MFKKEAEEQFKKKPLGYDTMRTLMELELEIYTEGFNDGYNKANEWHYVMDGDFPEAHKPILISDVFGHCESGYYFNGDWFGRDVMFHDVFAWKEGPLQSERMKLASEAILAKGREKCENQDL